ncbi:MAG: hypothetical protein HY923_10875 [Elusimicrobia bacterium]|nr:hypothetical protein [Elusimicrobiota bacterium]
MNKLLIAALCALPAAPLLAAPRCSTGRAPQLSGDAFSPVECSSVTKPSAMLPGAPVVTKGDGIKNDLRDLDGRWEGTMIGGLGRYALLLTVKTTWSGKAELVLDSKELQFRDRVTDKLALVSGKGRGGYDMVLSASLAPQASLKGTAVIGGAAMPSLSTGTAKAPPPDRQADLTFANGAVHRIYFALKGKDEMRVRAFSGIPGAPLQTFEFVLTRTKRESL